MKNGWFIGGFTPTAFLTSAAEVCYTHHKAGEIIQPHYHALAVEITLVVEGRIEIQGQPYIAGDIFIIRPGEAVSPIILEDTTVVVAKIPSRITDKHLLVHPTHHYRIAHRGNLNGRLPEKENSPDYIDKAISEHFDAEIDLWATSNKLYLGHDYPQYKIDATWLEERRAQLWVHIKNEEAVAQIQTLKGFNWFWQDSDLYTITSHGHVWAHLNAPEVKNAICVLPEQRIARKQVNIKSNKGYCSDIIAEWEDY